MTIVLRRRNQPALDALLKSMERGDPPAKPVTRKGFARRFGASAADFAAVRIFARRNRLAILNTDSAACTVLLSGSVAQINAAFGVTLMRYRHAEWGIYLGHAGTEPPHLKLDWLDGHTDGVIALTGGPDGPLDRALVSGQPQLVEPRAEALLGLFGDRLYVELQRHGGDGWRVHGLRAWNHSLYALRRRL